MTTFDLDGADPSACPLLGLEGDPRSHFTYPHPGHRCFATDHPRTADVGRQTTYCLSDQYVNCDRFKGSKKGARAGGVRSDRVG
jgi:hypothetical protein